MMTIYKALLRSHLEFANAMWYSNKIKDISTEVNVQRQATKHPPSPTDKEEDTEE